MSVYTHAHVHTRMHTYSKIGSRVFSRTLEVLAANDQIQAGSEICTAKSHRSHGEHGGLLPVRGGKANLVGLKLHPAAEQTHLLQSVSDLNQITRHVTGVREQSGKRSTHEVIECELLSPGRCGRGKQFLSWL